MAEDQNRPKDDSSTEKRPPRQDEMVVNMHKLFLEALRMREQQIVQFLAILVPALGAYLWLLRPVDCGLEKGMVSVPPELFTAGTVVIVFLLAVGAIYAAALGYNYRYVVLQCVNLEETSKLKDIRLKKWSKTFPEWERHFALLGRIPWCRPPAIINVFRLAFLVGIIGVGTSATMISEDYGSWLIAASSALALCVSLYMPFRYGRSLHGICQKEYKDNGRSS